MLLFKYLLKNITMLNMLLLAAAVITADYTLPLLFKPGLKYTLPVPKEIVNDKKEKFLQFELPPLSDYTIIPDNNIFHPERKIPVEKKTAQDKDVKKPEFLLYGTLIRDNLRIAYMQDKNSPYVTTGRGARQLALKKGDSISGYTVQDIDADKVVMSNGEETLIVYVRSQLPKTREEDIPTQPGAPKQPGVKIPPLKVPQLVPESGTATTSQPQQRILDLQPGQSQRPMPQQRRMTPPPVPQPN